MMIRRILPTSLLLLAAVVGWGLLPQDAPLSEHRVGSPKAGERAPPTTITLEGSPQPSAPLEDATTEPRRALSEPLARQRDRLDRAAIRLRARRDQAQANDVPEGTVHALQAHLARIEHRLATLDASPS